jgi:VWFA-related protein
MIHHAEFSRGRGLRHGVPHLLAVLLVSALAAGYSLPASAAVALPSAAPLAAPAAPAAPAVSPAPAASSAPPSTTAAAPRKAAPIAKQQFEDTTQVVSVEVPVNVTDREGHPVRGLTASDFEVYDEGSRQNLTHFEVVDLDSLRPEQSKEAQRPGAVATVDDIDAVDSSVRRHFLLLFDISFSSPSAILKARLAARDFVLHSLRPSDLAAVATYSLESGPRLIVTFTPDRAQVAHAIDTLGMKKSDTGSNPNDPLRFIVAAPSSISVEPSSAQLGNLKRQGGQESVHDLLEDLTAVRAVAEKDMRSYARSQINAYTRSLGAMAKALNGLKGRKTVVYFSEGFDSRLLLGRENLADKDAQLESMSVEYGVLQAVDNDNRYGNTGLQSAVNRMLEEFRRADCVIQAIDIGGLRAEGDASELNRSSGQEGLFYLANETGGELFKDANNFREQLEKVLNRSTVTYLLAFQRGDLKADGAFHTLKVKSRVGAVRLSYRTGYYAPRPYKELDPLEKSLLAADGIASATPHSDLDVDMLAAPFRSTPTQAYVPVVIEVGGPSLLAGGKGDKLSLELYAYVSDRQGKMTDFFTRRFGLDISKGREALAASGIKYYGHLDLTPGDYEVRVLVRDSDTGRTGVRSMALTVPTYKKEEAVLLPPMFMESGGRNWLMIRETAKEAKSDSVVYPFTLNGEPYVPAVRPALSAAEKAQLCLVAYNLGKGDLTLVGTVTASDGKPLPGGNLALVGRTTTGIAGLDKLLATFEPTGLGAGDYVLQVALTNRATGQKEINSLPFQVLR